MNQYAVSLAMRLEKKGVLMPGLQHPVGKVSTSPPLSEFGIVDDDDPCEPLKADPAVPTLVFDKRPVIFATLFLSLFIFASFSVLRSVASAAAAARADATHSQHRVFSCIATAGYAPLDRDTDSLKDAMALVAVDAVENMGRERTDLQCKTTSISDGCVSVRCDLSTSSVATWKAFMDGIESLFPEKLKTSAGFTRRCRTPAIHRASA